MKKLIVGLGNPGIRYANSRHNIGFRVIKSLSRSYKAPLKKDKKTNALSASCRFGSYDVILAEPLTFMNLSGEAVSGLIRRYKIDLANLLVISDDLDLEFGRMKIRAAGSSAGHRGIKSIAEALNTERFARLRIGIDRPHPGIDAAEYVLSPFSRREKALLEAITEEAAECCCVWATEGIEKSMNIFNVKKGRKK